MRTVAITSANAGGGRAATHAFARRAAKVALPARDPRALHDIACEVRAHGVEALPIAVDVGDAAARKLNR
ncbi:SDR family NAD(P)-dependent oxidoreductase [Burkholderia sp. Bp8991]|uniref:SDR family NAD(P)-dependent oxidoreductase n=1 Tax=Burkholderia sp. Bp8991 TaxID=2184553 RepID=UPI0021AB30DE